MKKIVAVLILAWIAYFPDFAADAPLAADSPAKLLKGKSFEQWVALLGSDRFDEREEASKTLIAAEEAAVPTLKKALGSDDTEVRLRAERALLAIAIVSIEGEFMRIASQSFSQTGRRTRQANESGDSTLSIQKGRLVFKQDYAKGIDQVYSFPEDTPLVFRNKCAIELNFESINNNAGYNPDSIVPKLECINTEQGLRLTFSATDTTGTSFRMMYAPKADVEKMHSDAIQQYLKNAQAETLEKHEPRFPKK